jgi:hypothetical protein
LIIDPQCSLNLSGPGPPAPSPVVSGEGRAEVLRFRDWNEINLEEVLEIREEEAEKKSKSGLGEMLAEVYRERVRVIGRSRS